MAVGCARLAGIQVAEHNFGVAHNIIIDSDDVHDVNGSDVKDDGGGAGINCNCWGDTVPTKFDGLLIENCHLTRTDRNGITTDGPSNRTSWFPSLNVVIRHNLLQDIGVTVSSRLPATGS